MAASGVASRLSALLAGLLVLMLIAGLLSIQRLREVTRAVETVYRDRVLPLEQLRTIKDGYVWGFARALDGVLDGQTGAAQAGGEIERLRAAGRRQWAAYRLTYLVDDEKRLIAESEPALADADAALGRAAAWLRDGDIDALRRFRARAIGPELAPAIQALDALMALQVRVAEAEAARSRRLFDGALWMMAGLAALAAVAGGLLAYAVLARYAAERRAAEAVTRRKAQQFQALFRTNPLGTLIVRQPDQVIVDLNDAMCARYGLTRDEMLGRTMQQLGVGIVDDDRARLLEAMGRDGRAHNVECRVRMRSGELRTSLVTAEPIEYLGQPCVIFLGLDVTELQAAEQARRDALAAEMANRAKTQFLSRMSHELRTPLNAVLGFSQLLQADAAAPLNASQQAQLGQIQRAGWHLLQLINDVLDVSRIETGQLHVAEQAVDLAAVARDAVRMSEPLARQHGISLRLAVPEAEPLGVLADPVRLRQVLLNLVSNAIKYNRAGGSVRVDVAAAGDAAQLEVIDTGLGMTREQMEHLFEPFNRLGRERGGIEGTGIGLAITLQLVQVMGGQLQVTSEAGVGTRVQVKLRGVALGSAAPAAAAEAAADSGEPAGTVLYIEDNPVNALLVEQLLSRWPRVQVQHASDGVSGLAAARRLQPRLVLLDMQLPDIDGIDVLRRLRADPVTAALPVVALSASAMPDEVAAARAAGAADYWTKPLDFNAFLRNVRRSMAHGVR